jgi:RHH-type rel operon transcriptional repressor/antitoxin RelB
LLALFNKDNKETKMLGVRLEKELEERLDWLAKQTGRTKSYHAKQAIKKYVEDREDYLIAVAALERLESGKERLVPLEELVKKYGLESSVHNSRRKTTGSTRPRRSRSNPQIRLQKTRRAA